MKNFENKTVLVTGGNSGFGYATAKQFAAEGAKVMITGRRQAAIEEAAGQLGVMGVVADQGNLADIDKLAHTVEAELGKLDVLFINAGTTGTLGPIEQMSEEVFDTVMGINFKGAYFTLSKMIPLLNDGASVVVLSSNTATTNLPNSSVYSASKAALNSMAKTAAVELAPRKIRVNILSPGPHETEIMKKAGLTPEEQAQISAHLLDVIPLKRMGQVEDVAKLVSFFSGPQAGFLTGAELVVDGGMNL